MGYAWGGEMVIKYRGYHKIVAKLVIAGSFLLAAGLFGNSASAMVTGRCDNCHTMHASQNGLDNTEVQIGDAAFPASWSGGVLADGSVHAPQARLLKTNCVGCHSNTGPETIVTIGTTRVPIVWNISGPYPADALAGGNFFGVRSNDTFGHNVGGISARDGVLAKAPGDPGTCNSSSCHANLAEDDASTPAFMYGGVSQGNFNGCKGCHNKVAHHDPDDTSYRYLGGHGGGGIDKVDGGAAASPPATNNEYEDPDWEQTNSSIKHNFYKNQTDPYDFTSIGRFCAGCHGSFHSMGATPFDPIFGEENGGDPNTDDKRVATSTPANPWMRHPTNVNIPGDGEYAQLRGQDYDPLIPVAQDPGEFGTGNAGLITFGDQVMCLSCHRAHASDKPDALRFEYSDISAHTSSGSTAGCFYCHRSKDD